MFTKSAKSSLTTETRIHIQKQEFSIKPRKGENEIQLLIYSTLFQEYIHTLERAENETPSNII